MTTFIKAKFKISDDQTNIYKYRLAANITEFSTQHCPPFSRITIADFLGYKSVSEELGEY